jgi:hypothetical protein
VKELEAVPQSGLQDAIPRISPVQLQVERSIVDLGLWERVISIKVIALLDFIQHPAHSNPPLIKSLIANQTQPLQPISTSSTISNSSLIPNQLHSQLHVSEQLPKNHHGIPIPSPSHRHCFSQRRREIILRSRRPSASFRSFWTYWQSIHNSLHNRYRAC